ncbi:EAL domain-containing protein [Novosphingobium sp.]|uniref:EAL domain-containing protein n=1 Tax=Novosphingobium sp. TaxID=1874826 RepID=UPI002733CBC5|nr:EAL domain-containing protein [Novosphingobium sp.]MDP3905741.1 EAL domain-containing protein [Novosphingobium sp.]
MAPKRSGRTDGLHDLIEPNWVLLAPAMAGALVLTGIATLSLPGLVPTILALLAIAITAATRYALKLEQARLKTASQRWLMMLAVVGLPMALFGIAMGWWTADIAGDWEGTLGILVIIGALGGLILKRSVTSIITAQVSLWAGAAVVFGSPGTFFSLTIGALVGIYTAYRQARADAVVAKRERERERVQQRAEQILSDFEQTGQGWFWETDRRGALSYVSPIVAQVLGKSPGSLLGRPFSALFSADPLAQESERSLAFHLTARSAFSELGMRAATTDEERWWSLTGRPVYDSYGNFGGFRGSGHDLTEKRRSEEHVSRLAHYDSLTGLANRLQMAQTLEKILIAPKLEHRACAVFLLDLDRFKQVNDTMGHPAGDALLKQVSSRLERTVGQSGRVGRLGGDEFQVILAGRHRREDLAALAIRIIGDLSEPYSIEGHRIVIGASVGIAMSPDDGVTAEALIRNADLALYAAKDGGRGRHHFYAADLHSDAEERRQLEQDLRDALSHGGLELHYQPVVHTATERITGFEALLRWDHPTRGRMSPAKFIPIAEDTGLIAQIGEWALRTACHDLASWPDSVRVAVNVSPLQFANPALPAIITSALASAQVDPARLELEITESVFLNDDAVTDAMFKALKRVGVRLALDDFGTGYSSLGYLKNAPFDKIKIDQSFVRGATIAGSRNGAIIAAIVSLAEALGMETTAEGVETLDELDLVRMLGCSHVQGYIYEKPLSIAHATQRLMTGLTAIARGPRAARASRQTMLRKIVLDHGGQQYHGTIRNISATGALVEGLWNVPVGTIFRITLTDTETVTATARWCQEDRMGIEFSMSLPVDDKGRIAILAPPGERPRSALLRRQA